MIRRVARKAKRIIKRVLRIGNYQNIDVFRQWIEEIEPTVWNQGELSYAPLISVVVPVYNVSSQMLRDCIDSVRKQTYENWELILVDDHSSWENVRQVLSEYSDVPNIRVIYRKENGNISEATNTGLAEVRGEFIACMDCDDVLAPQALYEVVYLLNENQELDFIYSDEDKITEECQANREGVFTIPVKDRHTPFFKPDWSPDAFMCLNYTNHLSVYRTEIAKEVGGLRTKYNGSQDYDFVLRFMEHTTNRRVGHVDKILYHWRERKESVAYDPNSKPYALEVAKKLKEEMIERRGLHADVEYVDGEYQYRLVYHNDTSEKVSIIIPSKDNFDILKHCLDTIIEFTDYPNYEVIIVDNGSAQDVQDKINAYMTLYKALVTVSKAAAPMIPFMTEDIYQNIVRSVDETAPESIHLCDFPEVNESYIDKELEENMERVLDIVVLGRACRNASAIKNRQPIGKMFVKAEFELSDFYKEIIEEELNVKEVEFTDDVRAFTSYSFKPQLRTVGPKYGKFLGKIKEALSSLDGNAAMDKINAGEPLTFDFDGNEVVLEKEDLLIDMAQVEGYVSESDNNITVVLDTKLSDELIEEGFVREIISKIQTMRKEADFQVMDKIVVNVDKNDTIKAIIENNLDEIKSEVLADNVIFGKINGYEKEWNINGEKVTFGVEKAL